MTDADKKRIEARYRAYCDACQAGKFEKLIDFWSLPASFTVELPGGETIPQRIINTAADLENLYGVEFGHSTGVDTTVIDESEVTFFCGDLGTIQTTLSHLAKGKLHDKQVASYGCRKIDGEWWFFSHISKIEAPK